MIESSSTTQPRWRRWLQSAAALLVGMVAVVALSIGTDAILHGLKVFPPDDQPMDAPALNLLALAYRSLYGVVGSWIAARLAPAAAMGHALALGVIGLLLSLTGVVITWKMGLGPHWYPIALVATALPLAWLGGAIQRAGRRP